jgi:hypothetical protein
MKDLCGFRDKLTRGETVIDTFSKTTDPAFVEASGYTGFDDHKLVVGKIKEINNR